MTAEKIKPKICYTASETLIVDDKIHLIKHKKLTTWLCPGGHIDPDEAVHEAAEREFWEETGVKVKAINSVKDLLQDSADGTAQVVPFAVNFHWVSKKNYENRCLAFEKGADAEREAKWKKGCEKHFNFSYLVKAIGDLNFHENVEEVDGIAWFSEKEVDQLYKNKEIFDGTYQEFKRAFELVKKKNL